MPNNEAIYLHCLNLFSGFGPKKLLKISNFFNSFEAAFAAGSQGLVQAGIEEDIAEKYCAYKKDINIAEQEEILEKNGINLITIKDENYPSLLLEISTPPPIIYCRGKLLQKEELCLAVVGTRNITNYGRTITPLLAEPLVRSGLVIVSGLAYGVDIKALEIAYENGKRSIAVLGGGIDDASVYPPNHVLAANRLLESGGSIISEYPPGAPSLKYHFLARNRIISGLSLAALVVECDLKSGSLITAKYALEQNRTVYAVPGPIYSQQSQGPNNLIKLGAKAVTEAKDILEDLNLTNLPQDSDYPYAEEMSPQETTLLSYLSFEPIHVNDIIKISGLEASQITSALTFLEMKGRIRHLGGQQYVLSR